MATSENQPSDASEIARCYRLHRPPFPETLFADLLIRAGTVRSDRLLDLACGTGRVALALAPAFATVTAVDLSPEMIAEGKAAAAEEGIASVTWHAGRAEDIDAASGSFRMVTVGDALHRFDQDALLTDIRRWLTRGGAVAILRSLDTLSGAEPWHRIVTDLVAKWTGRDTAMLTAPTHTTEACETVLKAHAFRDVASYTFAMPYRWSVEAILGNLASTSFCAKHVLGPIANDFAAEVRRALASYAPDGILRETMSFSYTFGKA